MTKIKFPNSIFITLRDTLARFGYEAGLELHMTTARVIVDIDDRTEVVFSTAHTSSDSFAGWSATTRDIFDSSQTKDTVYDNEMAGGMPLAHGVEHDSMLAAQALEAYLTGRTN